MDGAHTTTGDVWPASQAASLELVVALDAEYRTRLQRLEPDPVRRERIVDAATDATLSRLTTGRPTHPRAWYAAVIGNLWRSKKHIPRRRCGAEGSLLVVVSPEDVDPASQDSLDALARERHGWLEHGRCNRGPGSNCTEQTRDCKYQGWVVTLTAAICSGQCCADITPPNCAKVMKDGAYQGVTLCPGGSAASVTVTQGIKDCGTTDTSVTITVECSSSGALLFEVTVKFRCKDCTG